MSIPTNETTEFELTFAVGEGYNHENKEVNMKEVSEDLKKIAENIEKMTGLYISGVLTPAKMVYKTEWGCPVGGENGVTYTSNANPEFVTDINKWKDACVDFACEVKKHFKQSTVTVTFDPVEFLYIK